MFYVNGFAADGSVDGGQSGIRVGAQNGDQLLPSGRLRMPREEVVGANAAWLRLPVIAYNVLTALKRLALPADLLRARPKRLRFLIFYTVGRLVHHARQMRLRLARETEEIVLWLEALRFLPLGS
ncbi:MAG: transposase [Candidatus Acidiferrales bacterium]